MSQGMETALFPTKQFAFGKELHDSQIAFQHHSGEIVLIRRQRLVPQL